MMIKRLIATGFLFVLLLLGVHSAVWAQTGEISGMVTDSLSGESIPGANVVIVGTEQGTTTDVEGNYAIAGVSPGVYDVQASFVGYAASTVEEVEVVEGETTEVNFELVEDAVTLDEVVAVGYGTQQREDMTGSVDGIDRENLEGLRITSPTEALQGQISGLNITSTSGVPGGGPDIQLRGMGNVGAGGAPLYVVDGFALPQPGRGESLARNPLADIPPEDIESISVLKDASATAIYGSRGSNGVIIIDTRSGQSGTFEGNLSIATGVNQVTDRFNIIHGGTASAREFVEFQNFIWEDRVERGEASEVPEEYRNPEQYDGPDVDWWDEITRASQRHEVQGSVRGGFESVRSYFSLGLVRDEGLVLNHDYTRMTARANVESDLTDRLEVGLNLAPTYSLRNLNWEGGTARDGIGGVPYIMTPIEPVYDEDGNLNLHVGEESSGMWSAPNPVMWLQEEVNDNNQLSGVGSVFGEYELGGGLSARTQANVEYRTGETVQFNPTTIGGFNSPPPVTAWGAYSTDRRLNWLSETTLSLDRELGPGTMDAIAGFTVQEEQSRGSFFEGDFDDDEIRTLNVAEDIEGSTDEQGWSLVSGLFRANYSLLDRYVFTGTFRADGSSRFGADNRWGTFPSGAVAWNLHNEPFMEALTEGPVPELRLRFSYGQTGNNQIGNFAPLGVVSASDYVLGDRTATGRTLSSMENPLLGWEKSEEFNAAVDVSLYDYALDLTMEVYQRNTTQLLIDRELPWASGFSSVTENMGEVQNRGIEFELTSYNVNREDVSWMSNFNISLNRNSVTNLPGGEDIRYGVNVASYIHREGYPLASYAGYVIDGVYSPEQLDSDLTSYSGAVPGNMIFRDLDGDGTITEDVMLEDGGDFTILGNAYPDFTFGFTNTVRIGNFSARANITGAFGGDNFRAEHFRTSRNIDGLFVTDSEYVKNFYRSQEEPGDGLTPSPLGPAFGRQQYRDSSHSLMLSDASYLWLRDVTLRYEFGEEGVLSGTGLSGVSVYVTGSNLFVLSPYPGNPDVASMTNHLAPGIDLGNYPVPRSFTFGIDLSL